MKRMSKKYFHMRRGHSLEAIGFLKCIKFIFLGCFVLGIVYANILGEEKLTSFGILNDYFIEKFEMTSVRKESLFFYILEERLPGIILILVLVFTSLRLAAGSVFIGWQGLSIGFLLAAGIIKYGVKGILLIGGAVFPHYLIYVPLYIIYLNLASFLHQRMKCFKKGDQQAAYSKSKLYAVSLFVTSLIFCAFIIGIFLESYVNPPILKKILKFI